MNEKHEQPTYTWSSSDEYWNKLEFLTKEEAIAEAEKELEHDEQYHVGKITNKHVSEFIDIEYFLDHTNESISDELGYEDPYLELTREQEDSLKEHILDWFKKNDEGQRIRCILPEDMETRIVGEDTSSTLKN